MTPIKIWLLFTVFLFSVALARAQELSPPRERALMARVSSEINSNLACSTDVAALQDKIRELEQKLKAADKPEVPK